MIEPINHLAVRQIWDEKTFISRGEGVFVFAFDASASFICLHAVGREGNTNLSLFIEIVEGLA